MKNRLLSPKELKEFRLQQEEKRRLRDANLELKRLEEEKKNKKLASPKDLLDPKPKPVEVKEEPVVVEEPKDPIEVLRERLEEVASTIKEPKYYDEELAQLEVLISNKVELDEFNLEPINTKIDELRSQLSEIKSSDELDKLTERVDELQVSGSEIFQQHGENLKEIKKVIHQVLEDLVNLGKREIPEAFDPTDIQTDIAATKETFYERVAELKKELSELPEVKYYDDELTQLQERIETVRESIPEVPEIKYYDDDLENLLTLIAEVRGNIPEMPEVRYYEDEITQLEEAIKSVEDRIPEVKSYDEDISSIKQEISGLENKISELPEVKYYDKDIKSLLTEIRNLESKISIIPEIKYYDKDIIFIKESIEDLKNKIPEIPEVRYYEDDIKSLREEIVNVKEQIPELPEIPEPPEVKYYDEDINILSEDIDKVRDSLIDIKLSIKAVEQSVTDVEGREIPEAFDPTGIQIDIEKAFKEIEKLKEQPVTIKEDADPLVPLDQNFVTFDDLASHYRTFINRIQQQLTSLGGGGEVNLRYLDDIDRSSISDGKVLSYDAATKKFKFISPGAASSLWSEQGANIYRNSNVGINSADPQVALDVVGDARITGIVTVGTETITIDPILNRITIDAPGGNQIIIDGNDELIRVGAGASIITLDANAQTVTVGSGSSAIVLNATQQTINVGIGITIDGDSNTIQIGSDTINGNSGDAEFSGIVTAPTFVGEFVSNLDKTLEYQAGSLSTITTAQGTKTLYYDGAGILTSIIGTGVYVSKEFTYDGGGNLISVNVL